MDPTETATSAILQRMDLYKLLGVKDRDYCTKEAVKLAYRKRAAALHPDSRHWRARKFWDLRLAKSAHDVLADAKARAHYDRCRGVGQNGRLRSTAAASPTTPREMAAIDVQQMKELLDRMSQQKGAKCMEELDKEREGEERNRQSSEKVLVQRQPSPARTTVPAGFGKASSRKNGVKRLAASAHRNATPHRHGGMDGVRESMADSGRSFAVNNL
ncbi:hypothetical protein BV898_05904 [Hypsibius exemplaris]|uniref:J domain-containing protein n=1 Tax=Hypsibius exemplaris TaxID=2072580 RepID=A0A1W0WY29_HYPEX|nr:hypothetical protein BV898_05904 [Hypsibius exemplaris]